MRNRYRIGVAALALATAGLTFASVATAAVPATAATKSAKAVSYAIDAQPGTGGLDPIIASNAASAVYLNQIYETLLTRNNKGVIKPALASSYKKVDPLTYDFTIRSNAKFSDGTTLTPQDVVFSFQTWLASSNSRKSFLTGLDTVAVTGAHTVEFTFTTPDGAFINAVSSNSAFYIFSQKWYTSTSAEGRQRSALGTGPFALGKWVDNVSLQLKKNTHYWQKGKPKASAINFQIVPDESARLALVQQGSVDMANFISSNAASQAKSAGYVEGKASYTRKISIYLNPASGPLSDIRVRRALSLSLDRAQIVKLATEGAGAISLSVVAGDPDSTKVTSKTPYYTHNVKEAKKLLKQAGQPHPTIELSYPSDYTTDDIPVFEVVKQQAAKAGITIKLVGTPWSDISKIFTYGQSWTDAVAIWNRSNADYTGYFNQLLIDKAAFASFTGNADADKARALLATLTTETNLKKRAALAAQLDNEVASKVLTLIPVAKAETFEVWDSSKVGGYSTDPYNWRMNLKNVYVK